MLCLTIYGCQNCLGGDLLICPGKFTGDTLPVIEQPIARGKLLPRCTWIRLSGITVERNAAECEPADLQCGEPRGKEYTMLTLC